MVPLPPVLELLDGEALVLHERRAQGDQVVAVRTLELKINN